MSRPIKPALPGRKAKLSVDVLADIKNRVDAAAHAVGRGQGEEVNARLEWSFDFETRMGGPRVLHLLQTLASAALKRHPDGDAWIDSPDDYELIIDEWYGMMENAAPLDVAAKIARGRELIARLPTMPKQYQWRLRTMLAHMANLSRLPDAVRAEFAAAAEPPEARPLSETEVDKAVEVLGIPREQLRRINLAHLPPLIVDQFDDADDNRETVIAAAQPFMHAWLLAAAALGHACDETVIAEHFAQSAELHIVAGLHARRTAAELLRYRAEILALIDAVAASETSETPS